MWKIHKKWVWSLGQEDALEEETATHYSILAWIVPLTEEPVRPQSMRLQRAGHDRVTEHSTNSMDEGCWRRLWRVPWTARRSNQSILKEIGPGCSLEGLMLKLKLQYFGHLMWRADSLEKTQVLGKTEGRRRRGQQRMSGLDGITDSMDMSLGGLQELVMGREVHGVSKSRTQLSDWTELKGNQRGYCNSH